MSTVNERIEEIKTTLVGATGAKVLVVEGPDDVIAYQSLLERRSPAWERTWRIAEADTKSRVLKILQKQPDWLGLIDRDEWTDEECAHAKVTTSNLMVLPRFCLESYLVQPNELWQALPARQQAKIDGGFPTLESALAGHKNSWLRHAALWHTVQPLWRRLTAMGFTDRVLDPQAIPDDAALLETLRAWHDTLDADSTLAEMHRQLDEIQRKPEPEQYTRWLYAKAFYPSVVHRVLDDLLGQQSAKNRRQALFRTLPLPADLEPVWQAMGI